jgi:hypothetical protein
MVWARVGDEQHRCALLDEVARGEVAHLARADEQNGFAGERAEDLARELGGDRGDGDRGAADLGFGADALGDREGTLQEGVERGFDCADLAADRP